MDRLWAPWRIKYVLSIKDEKGCFLCSKLKENDDEKIMLSPEGNTVLLLSIFIPIIQDI